MYAVTFALPDESRDFRKLLSPGSGGGDVVKMGTLHGVLVAVGHIGVGEVAAAKGIAALLRQIRPELLICTGYGGALDKDLRCGDLVLDPCTSGMRIDPCNGLRIGAIHTVRNAAESVEDKRLLRAETGAHVVEMETEAVAAACTAAGVPMLALRVVSDEAEQPLPVPMAHWFDLESQRPRPLALVRYLLAHPRAIAPFARFVGGLSGARTRLAVGISEVIAKAAAHRPH